jgi:hypothetical protein
MKWYCLAGEVSRRAAEVPGARPSGRASRGEQSGKPVDASELLVPFSLVSAGLPDCSQPAEGRPTDGRNLCVSASPREADLCITAR